MVDEAHHYAESGGPDPDETERSQRRKLGELLARRSDSLLLLSATPHDGYERSFASLLELLDPCLVDGGGLIRGQQYREHLVRRLKQHVWLTNPQTGSREKFKERKVIPVEINTDDALYRPFVHMHQRLLFSIVPELKRAMAARNYDDALAYLALLKRSASTVEALYLTLERVQARLHRLAGEQQERAEAKGQRLRTLRSLEKKLARFGSLSPDEEAERQELEIEDLAQKIRDVSLEARVGRLAAQQSRFAADTLLELKEAVEAARACDPKLDEVMRQIRSIRASEPEANVLVYTEYKDSQQRLVEALLAADFAQPLTLSGEDSEADRLTINDIFRTRSNQILVATDAAAEGLNLQYRCHHLI
ncbi:MAG TPA: helicase-related protein, partial [Ktedonobacteraceae bacterium]|nr:helicase-related protein [Ktedonobacteraceae bacterium]